MSMAAEAACAQRGPKAGAATAASVNSARANSQRSGTDGTSM